MLSLKVAIPAKKSLALVPASGIFVRGFATQKQLKQRIKSIQTIMKVTKAMKMVASARVKSVTQQLDNARKFQNDISKLMQTDEEQPKVEKGEKWLMVPVAADRGLCGAVNSAVNREARRQWNVNANNTSPQVFAIGSKAIAGLLRLYESQFAAAISEQKPGKRMTFRQVSLITEMIRSLEWNRATVVYNKFKNAMTYVTTAEPFYRFDSKAQTPKGLSAFEVEGDQDCLKNLDEFRTVCRFWQIWAENEASEISSRVNAMENSNKAAKEMAEALNIKANKLRQAKITLEICDIVAGAETAL